MFRRIIVAVDGSSTSRRALREAIDLASDRSCALCIVSVLDIAFVTDEAPFSVDDYEASVRKSAEKVLEAAAAAARKSGVSAETKLLAVKPKGDRVSDEIARFARRWKADLIVIGTHGRRGVSRLFLGSVAETVARGAPTPVLLVRGR